MFVVGLGIYRVVCLAEVEDNQCGFTCQGAVGSAKWQIFQTLARCKMKGETNTSWDYLGGKSLTFEGGVLSGFLVTLIELRSSRLKSAETSRGVD